MVLLSAGAVVFGGAGHVRAQSSSDQLTYLFAAVLIIELLTSCGLRGNDTNDATTYNAQGPLTARAVVVKVNSQNRSDVQYLNLDSTPSQQNFNQFLSSSQNQNWQPVQNDRVISGNQGYNAAQPGSYFIQQPRDFVAQNQANQGQQNLTAGYFRGGGRGGGAGYGGCGYCNYPNYYGYGGYNYNHYYPSTYVNYDAYNYLPTYYSNYSYWYYQPTFYYPSYGYNYYIYNSWW